METDTVLLLVWIASGGVFSFIAVGEELVEAPKRFDPKPEYVHSKKAFKGNVK